MTTLATKLPVLYGAEVSDWYIKDSGGTYVTIRGTQPFTISGGEAATRQVITNHGVRANAGLSPVPSMSFRVIGQPNSKGWRLVQTGWIDGTTHEFRFQIAGRDVYERTSASAIVTVDDDATTPVFTSGNAPPKGTVIPVGSRFTATPTTGTSIALIIDSVGADVSAAGALTFLEAYDGSGSDFSGISYSIDLPTLQWDFAARITQCTWDTGDGDVMGTIGLQPLEYITDPTLVTP